MNLSFEAQNGEYPSIYRIHFDKPSELFATFKDVVLKDATVGKVREELVKYVTTVIEPLDWKAIWRTSNESCALSFAVDFEVEVIDVSRNSLEATVIVKRLLCPELSVVSVEDRNAIEALMSNDTVVTVPLIELYVINEDDDNCQFLQTAMAIEHIRFFWKCIWRPWDNSPITPHDNIPFLETHFTSRFDLYCDIQNKVVVKSTVNKINKLLEEAWKVRKRMDSILSSVGKENVEKEDIDESVMYETLKLRYKLEEMERAMRLFEDPFSRVIASSVISNLINNQELVERGKSPTLHFLAKYYDYSMLKEVMSFLEKSELQEVRTLFHLKLNDAIETAVSGDKIIIMPGVYLCDSIRWLDVDLIIEGQGAYCDDVVIKSRDDVGDVFLHCNASKIELSNLTLRTSAATRCIIMVHTGFVRLNNCILDGADNTHKAFITLSQARVAMDNCNITKKADNGMMVSPGGDVTSNGGSIFGDADAGVYNESE